MKTLDILGLPKNESSLSIVKSYLQTQLPKSDYEIVFLHMLEIELHLNLNEHVIIEGEEFLNNFSDPESKHYSRLLKILFDASLNLRDFDRSMYYLDEHRKYVPILQEYIVKEDEIKLAKIMNQPYFDALVSITREPAPNEVKVPYYEELVQYLIERERFAEAKESLEDLLNITDKKYYQHELDILFGLEMYEELIKKANGYLNNKDALIPTVLALAKTYFKLGNDHQLTIIDSNYTNKIEEAELSQQREYYEIYVELYSSGNYKKAEEEFREKLKNVKRLESKLQKAATKGKEDQVKIQVELTEVQPRKIKYDLSSEDEKRQISNFLDIFMFAENINEKFILRDFLRTLFIHIDNYIKPSDYVIYLNDGRFYHYKKERLYEKRIVKELTQNTIVNNVNTHRQEVFSNPLDFEKNIDIITQLPYTMDVKYVYGIPLESQGAFLVYFDEEISDPEIYYDFIKLLSGIIFSKLNREDKLKVFRKENFFLTNILKSDLVALRTLSEVKTTYNELAQKMFNQEEHDYVDHFIMNLKSEYIREYRELIKKMFSKPGQVEKFTYQYKNLFIEEKLISILDDEQIKVVSMFQDITDIVIKIESSEQKAITDSETRLFNISYLKQQMHELLKTKVTFIAIELNLDNRHLYGVDNTTLYFKEFVKITDNFFVDGTAYRTDFNEVMITLPFNDVRSVNNIIKEYAKYINNYQVLSIPHEQFRFKMGVLRYPVVTNQTNIDKILKFIDIAKEKSKLYKDQDYHQFLYNDYEEEVFEQTVINYLSESLENKNLNLKFTQIIDNERNLVWQYESQIIIPNLNIDPNYLLTIAKKRNRIIELERFHVTKVLDYLVKLSQEAKVLIKITIPISEASFLDPTFNSFLIGEIKERKLPFSYIRLKVNLGNIKTHHYAHKIHHLLANGIALDTTSLAMALTYPFDALYIDFNDSDIKWQSYYQGLSKMLEEFHIALIATNVNKKEHLETIKRLGIKYLTGSIYPQISADDLLEKIVKMRQEPSDE